MLKKFFIFWFIVFENFEGVDVRISELALSNSIEQIQISFVKFHVFIVCEVVDFSPPVFVSLSLHKLFKFVLMHWLNYLLTFDCVTSMIM
jgi:hypothetical protein